jgi:hypothetical protein
MSLQFETEVLEDGICLLRSQTARDKESSRRWFSYYGKDQNVNNFCNAHKFAKTHLVDGGSMQHYRIVKPIHLITFPYLSMEEYDSNDVDTSLNLAITILQYINTKNDDWDGFFNQKTKLSKNEAIHDILELLVPYDDDHIDDEQTLMNYNTLINIKQKLQIQSHTRNIDYTMAKIVCKLGFNGWKRIASKSRIFGTDEIFICDIEEMEGSYLSKDSSCNICKDTL